MYVCVHLCHISHASRGEGLQHLSRMSVCPHFYRISTAFLPHLYRISTASLPHRYRIATASLPHVCVCQEEHVMIERCVHARMHQRTNMHDAHTNMHATHMHATQKQMQVCKCWIFQDRHNHARKHARKHARTHKCMHTHMHTHMHTQIYTRIHMHTHSHQCWGGQDDVFSSTL